MMRSSPTFEVGVDYFGPPPAEKLGKVYAATFDKHVQEGKRSLGWFAKANKPVAEWCAERGVKAYEFVATAAFYTEGAVVDRKVHYAGSKALLQTLLEPAEGDSRGAMYPPSVVSRHTSRATRLQIYCTDLGGYDDSLAKGDIEMMHLVPKERVLNYLGGDVDGTLRVSNVMHAEIAEQPALRRFYTKLLHPGAKGFQRIEREGVSISLPRFKQLQIDLEKEITALSAKGLSLIPSRLKFKYADNLSLSRAAILKDYFFGPMGLNLKPKLLTGKTQEPSTAKSHLEMCSPTRSGWLAPSRTDARLRCRRRRRPSHQLPSAERGPLGSVTIGGGPEPRESVPS